MSDWRTNPARSLALSPVARVAVRNARRVVVENSLYERPGD